jgi:hypothetical protein
VEPRKEEEEEEVLCKTCIKRFLSDNVRNSTQAIILVVTAEKEIV